MMTKFTRPFWILNIDKIEKWLSFMAAKGQHLVKFLPFPGTFVFKPGEPKDSVLRISYTHQVEDLTTIKHSGWEEVVRHKNFYVLANTIPANQLKIFPARDGLVDRILFFLNRIGLLYWAVLIVMFYGIATFALLAVSRVITFTVITPTTLWWLKYSELLTMIIGLALFGLGILLTHLSHKLLHKDQWLWDLEPFSCQHFTVRRMFGWVFSPDKLEQWLEKMELQGYQLRSVNRTGLSFSFARTKSRKVKYCVDFQLKVNRSYFACYREAGWKLCYTGLGSFAVWTIWAKQYENQAPQPLYTDQLHLSRHALLVSTSQTCSLIPHIIILACIVRATITDSKCVSIIYGLVIVLLISLIIRAWLYYRRMQKQATAYN